MKRPECGDGYLDRGGSTSLIVPGGSGVDGGVPGSDVVGPPGRIVSALDVLELEEHIYINRRMIKLIIYIYLVFTIITNGYRSHPWRQNRQPRLQNHQNFQQLPQDPHPSTSPIT